VKVDVEIERRRKRSANGSDKPGIMLLDEPAAEPRALFVLVIFYTAMF
jgi:hypothetical protein